MQERLKKIYSRLSTEDLTNCPIREVFSVVSDKWSILIFFNLGVHARLRFNELKSLVQGISSKILAERLKRLERDGYILRTVYPEVPVKVEYQLTDLGKEYVEQATPLIIWITKQAPAILERRKGNK
ncbi:MAG: helix-turn-helix domain-containing protein [Bacteroidota bacterium]